MKQIGAVEFCYFVFSAITLYNSKILYALEKQK